MRTLGPTVILELQCGVVCGKQQMGKKKRHSCRRMVGQTDFFNLMKN